MSLKNSTWFNGRHERNAVDLQLLSQRLHQGPVLYAGYSAGGLAAFLAAAHDKRATAYLGLDAVDSGGLAVDTRDRLAVPSLFLLAEVSSCNARNNIQEAVPDRPGVRTVRVPHATHCHFENPTDTACESLCGRVEPPEAEERIVAGLRSLATAWVLEQAEIRP
jgi:dienelactone hydrolase